MEYLERAAPMNIQDLPLPLKRGEISPELLITWYAELLDHMAYPADVPHLQPPYLVDAHALGENLNPIPYGKSVCHSLNGLNPLLQS